MANEFNSPPNWLKPAGIGAIATSLLAFVASAIQGGGGTVGGALVAGLLNPLFFVGLPLGMYWLNRHAILTDRNRPKTNATTRIPLATTVWAETASQAVGECPQTSIAIVPRPIAQRTPVESAESIDEIESLRRRLDRLEAENAQLKRQLQQSSPSAIRPQSAQNSGNPEAPSALDWSSKGNTREPRQDPRALWLLVAGIVVVFVVVIGLIFKTGRPPIDVARPLNPEQRIDKSALHDNSKPELNNKPTSSAQQTAVKSPTSNQAIGENGTNTALYAREVDQELPVVRAQHVRENEYREVPPIAKYHYAKGIEMYNVGDYPAALKLFSLALDEGFIDELALANRAVARLRTGDTKNAIKDLESALEFGSLNGDIYFTLAYALYLEGEFDRALTYLSTAIRLQPDDDRSHRYRDVIDRAKRERDR